MADRPQPRRGEVWWVRPGRTAGAQLQKKRPYVVISADAMGNDQVKSFDTGKFIERQGRSSAAEIADITAALAIVVEYE